MTNFLRTLTALALIAVTITTGAFFVSEVAIAGSVGEFIEQVRQDVMESEEGC